MKSPRTKWNLNIFLHRASLIHGDKYEYVHITPNDAKKLSNRIKIVCKKCQYLWEPTLGSHIHRKSGCPKCAGQLPWTLKLFQERALLVHGDKFDYSNLRNEDIKNHESWISIFCNQCLNFIKVKVDNHIQGRGCLRCAGQLPWTFDRFCSDIALRSELVDYSNVTENDITFGIKSNIPMKCLLCNYYWSPTIGDHFGKKKTGCPKCVRRQKYTLENFKEDLKDCSAIDISLVTEIQITSKKSRVVTLCRICNFEWYPRITSLLSCKNKCPQCRPTNAWTYDSFLIRAKSIHGDKIDYSEVTKEQINGALSHVSLSCAICRHNWKPTIGNHIVGQHGCPLCNQYSRWDGKKLLKCIEENYANKFNHSISESMVLGAHQRVMVSCKVCNHISFPRCNAFSRKNFVGCQKCSNLLPWNLAIFIERAKQVHGQDYDYSSILETDIVNQRSKVELKCIRCNHIWKCNINNHVNNNRGCPSCRFSHGENNCKRYFTNAEISFQSQYRNAELSSNLSFDFFFESQGKKYLLEYDGGQHFEFTGYFHKSMTAFDNQQIRDCKKSIWAITNRFLLIRIDFTCEKQVPWHINRAIDLFSKNHNLKYYFSNNEKYRYILETLEFRNVCENLI